MNHLPDLAYTIGPDEQRRISELYDAQDNLIKKIYYNGNYELIEANGNTYEVNYLSSPEGLFGIAVKENNNPVQVYYVETDHLGSILGLYNEAGQPVYTQSFDAWGRERNPETWDYTTNTGTKPEWLIRGYTGHEHLPEFGLVNMNARLYDPILGRMLSPDIYVHIATQTQGYNRYSYVLNNPLKYTDPDGNEPISAAIILVGMVAGGYTGYKIADSKGYNFSNWQMYAYIYGGMAVGAFSAGAGAATAAGGGIAANTMGIVAGSSFSSTGFSMLSGMQTPVVTSIGVASYDWTNNEWGYLGKPGNSTLQNVGYGFGAMANVQDLFAGFNGGSINVFARKKLAGHSWVEGDDINISVANDGYPKTDPKYANADGLKWELPFLRKTVKGRQYDTPYKPENVFKTKINNVNVSKLQKMSKNLEDGLSLDGKSELLYGYRNGCVNHTSRALLRAGVFNVNAFLPITAPAFLNFELSIRYYAMFNSFYFTNP